MNDVVDVLVGFAAAVTVIFWAAYPWILAIGGSRKCYASSR